CTFVSNNKSVSKESISSGSILTAEDTRFGILSALSIWLDNCGSSTPSVTATTLLGSTSSRTISATSNDRGKICSGFSSISTDLSSNSIVTGKSSVVSASSFAVPLVFSLSASSLFVVLFCSASLLF